jgi:replicative DNA helicase
MTDDKKVDLNDPEILLVAGSLLRPALASEAAQYVDASDFSDQRLRFIWTAITGMLDEGVKTDNIDPVGVGRKCGDTPEKQMLVASFCDDLVSQMPRITSLVMSAHRVRRRATMRLALARMREIAADLKSQIESNDGDAPDLDENLAGLSITVTGRSDKEKKRTTFKDMAPQVLAYFDKLASNDTSTYIPTGLTRLDDFLGGGLRPGQLHVVLGSTGSGKSALASQVCDHAVLIGKRAIMFSMEVDPLDVFIRDIEREAGRSRWDLRYNNTRDAAISDLAKAMGHSLERQNNKIVYGEPISVEGIRQAILTERLRTGPIDMIVVDHAQVAVVSKSDKRNMPRYLEVKSVAEGLRAIARQLGVAVVLTAQLNPSPKGDTPTMSLVRESKDINMMAEVVIMIWHEKQDGIDGGILLVKSWLYIEKARAGREGKLQIKYNGKIFRFEEIAKDSYGT